MNNADKIYNLAVPGVQKLVPYTPGKPIAELERELGLTHIIKLASNENSLGVSKKVIEALNKSSGEVYRYPDSSSRELRKSLGRRLTVLGLVQLNG